MNKQKIYNIASLSLIAILVLILLFQKSCSGSRKSQDEKTVIKSDTVLVVDTLVRIKTDTLWQKEFVYLPQDKPEAIPTPLPQPDVAEQSEIKTFAGTQTDTAVTIHYRAKTKGELLEMDIKYKLKQPRVVYKEVEKIVTKKDEIITRNYQNGFYLGGFAGFSAALQEPSLGLGATLTTKKGLMYEYDYDVLLKMHTVGIKYRLFPIRRPK